MKHDGIDYLGRFTSFRHVGVFPEQASHWDHMAGLIATAKRPLKVLNLFGYTGLASLVAAKRRRRGHPCRCLEEGDRLGPRKSGDGGLGSKPIRWIVDDAMKFIRARGAPRQPLRHHPVRPAEIRPRPQWRSLAAVRSSA
jgi:23S rRNA (cytosine1962-C5)-methyltransferase